MWEADRYEWSRLRAMGSAVGVPAAIEDLHRARSEKEAKAAYDRIQNVVIVEGRLFEAAAATAACLVDALPSCSSFGRPNMMQILVDLGNAVPDPSEIALGNTDLGDVCQRELTRDFGVYVNIFEDSVLSSRLGDVVDSVDLLLLCGLADKSLNERVSWLYTKALDMGTLPEDVAGHIRGSRNELIKENSTASREASQ